MRKVFSWLAVTLVVSALATAAVANYVQNHPTCALAHWAGRAAALCTAAPTAAEQPARCPATIVSMDGQALPDALIDMSPELKSACSYDIAELRAIAEMEKKPDSRVVCAVPEDEFTLPALPKPHEHLVVVADGIVTEFINDYPAPMAVTSEPQPEPLPMPEPSFDVELDFNVTGGPGMDIDLTLPSLPFGHAPLLSMFNTVKELIGACVKGLTEECPNEEAKPIQPDSQLVPPWVSTEAVSHYDARLRERAPVMPPCASCPPCQYRYRTADGLERVGIDFEAEVKSCQAQGCDDACHLDLKNVLIVVAEPGAMPGPNPVYVQYFPTPEATCDCCKDCQCGKSCACGKTQCTKGCLCKPTAAHTPPWASQAGVPATACWVQAQPCPGAPMCVPLPPGCPVTFPQACQAVAACCPQAKLVRKVYPVGGLMDPDEDSTEEDIIRIVCRTVCPATWDEMGGAGVIDYFPLGKSLVVLQTEEVHREIATLLNDLETAKSLSSQPPVAGGTSSTPKFASFIAEGVVQTAAACQEQSCSKECPASPCCKEGCCKDACITIEVSDPECYLDVWQDASGLTHVSCKGLRLSVPLSGVCHVKVVRGTCCAANESACPWYECGEDVEFVPYIPADGAAVQSDFEDLLRQTEKEPRGGLGEPSTPEDLPVPVEPTAGRFGDVGEVCPVGSQCTRDAVIRRQIEAIPGTVIRASAVFSADPVWQTVLDFQRAEGTGK